MDETQGRKTVWQQLVQRKNEWIGGAFYEIDDMIGAVPSGIIKDMTLTEMLDANKKPTGNLEFRVVGDESGEHSGFAVNTSYYGFGGCAAHGGLSINGTFAGSGSFEICQPKKGQV